MSLSSFTFIKRLFSSSSLSAITVVSAVNLRLLRFLPAILIQACASSSPVFLMMYSAYELNKQGDNIQPWHILSQFGTKLIPHIRNIIWYLSSSVWLSFIVKESYSESCGMLDCLFILLQSGRVPWSFIVFLTWQFWRFRSLTWVSDVCSRLCSGMLFWKEYHREMFCSHMSH